MIKSSLRQQLILPFISMVAFVALAIGWVSFQATSEAVGALTQRVLLDMAYRVSGMTGNYLAEVRAAVVTMRSETEAPTGSPAFSDNLALLEEQFWSVSSSARSSGLGKYVYYGGEDGRFVGVNRIDQDFVELYLRKAGEPRRSVYAITAPGDRGNKLRSDNYDPRRRPWYEAAARQTQPVWSPVYSEFTSGQPTITFAKALYRADRRLAGVVATDITLTALTDLLRTLTISKNGVAFLMDADGFLIATSNAEVPFKSIDYRPQRIQVKNMRTELIREAGARALKWNAERIDLRASRHAQFTLASGVIEMAATRIDGEYGLDWTVVVAAPRADFMQGVTRSLYNGLVIASVCILIVLLAGLSILNGFLADIRKLTGAAKKIGEGEPLSKLEIDRNDELGQLARTLVEMEHNLRTDRLTGVATREWLLRQVALLQRQRSAQAAFRIAVRRSRQFQVHQ